MDDAPPGSASTAGMPVPAPTALVAVGTALLVALFPDDGNSIEELLEVADVRLLEAKRRRRPASRQRQVA